MFGLIFLSFLFFSFALPFLKVVHSNSEIDVSFGVWRWHYKRIISYHLDQINGWTEKALVLSPIWKCTISCCRQFFWIWEILGPFLMLHKILPLEFKPLISMINQIPLFFFSPYLYGITRSAPNI